MQYFSNSCIIIDLSNIYLKIYDAWGLEVKLWSNLKASYARLFS